MCSDRYADEMRRIKINKRFPRLLHGAAVPGGCFVKYDFLDEGMLRKLCLRIPTVFRKSDYTKAVIKKLVFAFSVCAFSRPESGRDKKDAEASKNVTSPYKRTAETVFGGRKSG